MGDKIKRLVAYYKRKYNTNDPYELADCLNIIVIRQPLGEICGYYKYINRRKCIFINSEIEDDNFLRVIMAHEIGHAVLHKTENCAFIKNHTLLLTSKFEIQANSFAAYYLIDDAMLLEYAGYTKDYFCCCTGYPKELIELRMKMLD